MPFKKVASRGLLTIEERTWSTGTLYLTRVSEDTPMMPPLPFPMHLRRRSVFIPLSFLTAILVGLTIQYINESLWYRDHDPLNAFSRSVETERGLELEPAFHVGAYFQALSSSNLLISNGSETLLTTDISSTKNVFRCPNHLYTQGHWERREENFTSRTDSTSTKYVWMVEQSKTSLDSCHLELCNKDAFCETLQGRSILIVGDSINLQFFRAISLFLRATGQQFHQKQQLGKGLCVVHASARICNSTSRVTYVRNDHLEVTSVLADHVTGFFINIPWLYLLPSHEVLFLNTGAHSRLVDEYKDAMANLSHELFEKQQYSGSVWFRTTPRGHPNCQNNDTVIAKANDEDWSRYFSPDNHDVYTRYNYNQFPIYNQMMIDVFGDRVLDVAPMTELRPDGHQNPPKDCLHYSANKESFMDVYFGWIQLFYNGLKGNLS